MQQDNFGDALSLLEQMLKIFPENKTALLYKAEIGIQTCDKQITEAALKSLILIAPHNLQYSITLAQLYFDNGELERAPKVFEPLIQQFKHPDLHFNYAWFLTRAADYNNALENYQKAIDLGLQGSEEAHLNMANIYSSFSCAAGSNTELVAATRNNGPNQFHSRLSQRDKPGFKW